MDHPKPPKWPLPTFFNLLSLSPGGLVTDRKGAVSAPIGRGSSCSRKSRWTKAAEDGPHGDTRRMEAVTMA